MWTKLTFSSLISCLKPANFILSILAFLWISTAISAEPGPENLIKRLTRRAPGVLILHSYHPGLTWTDNVNRGITETFKTKAPDADLYYEYMDAGRMGDTNYKDHFRDFLASKYTTVKIDIVISSGDPALFFLLNTGKALFPDIPIIFCAVDRYDAVLNRRTNGPLTGIIEKKDITETINTALKLHPDTKKIVYITDKRGRDTIPEGLAEKTILQYGNNYKIQKVEYAHTEQLRKTLAGLTQGTIVMAFIFNKDVYKRTHEETLKHLTENCKVPIYGIWKYYLGHGIVGGMLTSGETHGRTTAEIAALILAGENPSDFPVVHSGLNQYMFDHQEMMRFGIRERDLPEGSSIINRPYSVYDKFTYQFWSLGIIITVLVILVIFFGRNLVQKRRIEIELRENKERFSLFMDYLPAIAFVKDENSKIIFMNQKAIDFYGKKDWRGKTAFDFLPKYAAEQSLADDMDTLSKGYRKRIETRTDRNNVKHVYETHKFRMDRQDNRPLIGGFAIDITQRIKAENSLRESEKRYRELFENEQDAHMVLDTGTMLFEDANTAALNLYGYTRSEFYKIGPEHISSEPETAIDRVKNLIAEKGRRKTFTRYHTKKDGTVFPVEVTMGEIEVNGRKKIFASARDITDRKHIEGELRRERNRAQMYLDVAGVIFVAFDSTGKVILMNRKGCEILGYEEHEIVGRIWFDTCLPVYLREDIKNMFCRVMTGSVEIQEYTEYAVLTKNYEERHIAWHNAILKDENGHISGAISSGEDITDRKKAEAEKEKLTDHLRQAQKIEAIGTLAGGVAHDFNNILSPMLGYAEILKSDIPLDSPLQNYVDGILNAITRSRELVRQILTFSRQGKQEVIPMQLQPVVREVMKLLRSTIPTTIDIQQDIDPTCGVVNADPTQIHQIIMNLATNAYHAMEDTGGTLELTLKQVRLDPDLMAFTTLPSGEYVRLTVADTGIGMENNVLEKIFDPYFTTKDTGKGTGLGLSIVQGIVKGGNGDICIFSTPGQGTEIQVYLPILDRRSNKRNTRRIEPIQGGTEKILLVDDEEAIISMEKRILERLGYDVTTSLGSIDALGQFKSRPENFDLIISDMTMPKMTGVQLTKEIRKTRPDIPVILCTGYSDQIDEERSKTIGIQGFVMKPVSMREIAEATRKALSRN